MDKTIIEVKGGHDMYKAISLYRAMYNAYKGNIGNNTKSGNKITQIMVDTLKGRMLDLMVKKYAYQKDKLEVRAFKAARDAAKARKLKARKLKSNY